MMLNSPAPLSLDPIAEDKVIEEIVSAGPWGAIALAGTATAVVIGLWFAFFLLVFLPRGTIQ